MGLCRRFSKSCRSSFGVGNLASWRTARAGLARPNVGRMSPHGVHSWPSRLSQATCMPAAQSAPQQSACASSPMCSTSWGWHARCLPLPPQKCASPAWPRPATGRSRWHESKLPYANTVHVGVAIGQRHHRVCAGCQNASAGSASSNKSTRLALSKKHLKSCFGQIRQARPACSSSKRADRLPAQKRQIVRLDRHGGR